MFKVLRIGANACFLYLPVPLRYGGSIDSHTSAEAE